MRKFMALFTASVYAGIFSASMMQAQAATKIKGNDVLINGDSFFALSGQIKTDLEKLARNDSVIGSNESFRNAAVSGSMLAAITTQYSNANPKPKYVIMDGSGNDVLLTTCATPPTADCAAIKNAINGVQPLLDKMAAGGTKKVLWMRYAEPGGNQGSVIKAKLDVLMPEVEKICRKSTNPKVMWYDLRPVWGNKGIDGSYSTDGLHPTAAGAQATADAFWKAIKDSNFFDTGSTPTSAQQPVKIVKSAPFMLLGQGVFGNRVFLSLFLAQPGTVTMRISTVLGQTVACAEKHEQPSGFRTVQLPLGAIAPGIYCLDIKTGRLSERSSLLVR
jgi:lysophospholipase L1-like esterase